MTQVTSKKILIVEDDKDFLWILRQSFANQDVSIVFAVDGEEGLAMAQKEKPDLIIIDIGLPKMDGMAMAKAIKEKGITASMIFLTNQKDAEHITQAISIGNGADYIIKSDTHMDAIVDMVKGKLGLK